MLKRHTLNKIKNFNLILILYCLTIVIKILDLIIFIRLAIPYMIWFIVRVLKSPCYTDASIIAKIIYIFTLL